MALQYSLSKTVIVFFAIGMWTTISSAAECESIKTFKQILKCVDANHPTIQRAKSAQLKSEKLIDQAGQTPNIELSGKAMRNSEFPEQNSGELGVTYTWEMGGKRNARQEKARSEAAAIQIEISNSIQETKLQIAENLYQLKYLKNEEALIDGGISTFEKILKSYHGRLRLSPEQEVSLSVFSLALEEYKIRKSANKVDQNFLLRSLAVAVGGNIELSDALFPPDRMNWPDKTESKEVQSPQIQLLEASLGVAKSEVKLAESEAWPDFKIGPNYEWTKQAESTEKSFGLVFSLPLPLWNRNQGGIAASLAESTKIETDLSFRKKETLSERNAFLVQYQEGVKSLKNTFSRDELLKRRKTLNSQFTRGLIPSSLVIESNRQLLDFFKVRNELEIKTLQSLWRLEVFDGEIPEILK